MRKGRLATGIAGLVLAVVAVTPALGGQPVGHERKHDTNPAHSKTRAAKIEELYQNLIFPTPTLILAGQVSVSHIFDTSVEGRVTPVGQFHDPEGVNEYFFGLASTPTSRVVAVDIKSLVASGDKVAVEVDIRFDRPSRPPAERFQTLRQTGFFTFNKRNRVVSFDLAILNLGAAINPTSEAERQANIQGVCALLTTGFPGQPATCPGTYASFPDCVAFMNSIPYGTWDRANSNTVVCRQLHSLLTPFRPDVHCPHCSPGGAHTCIDFTYDSFFEVEF